MIDLIIFYAEIKAKYLQHKKKVSLKLIGKKFMQRA